MCTQARLQVASWNRAYYRTLFFLFAIPTCSAVLVNRTIDSNNGDLATGFMPIYQPQSRWVDTCSACSIQPNAAKAFDGTWEAAIYNPFNHELQNVNITLQFTGVAVWVFFILATATNTQLNITLDGQYAGNFSYGPDLRTFDAYIYNATIFSTSGLSNTSHTLVIATNDYPIFDWAMYTADVDKPPSSSSSTTFSSTAVSSSVPSASSTSTASTSSSSQTGIIVGSTLGTLVVVALALVFIIRHLRRARPVQNKETGGILDIDVPPAPSASGNYAYFPPSPSAAQSAIRGEASNMARLREMRQMKIDCIQSVQREMDNLKTIRNLRSSGGMACPSAARPSTQSVHEIASLRNEMQQLRDQVGHLQANYPLPPAYTLQWF